MHFIVIPTDRHRPAGDGTILRESPFLVSERLPQLGERPGEEQHYITYRRENPTQKAEGKGVSKRKHKHSVSNEERCRPSFDTLFYLSPVVLTWKRLVEENTDTRGVFSQEVMETELTPE